MALASVLQSPGWDCAFRHGGFTTDGRRRPVVPGVARAAARRGPTPGGPRGPVAAGGLAAL